MRYIMLSCYELKSLILEQTVELLFIKNGNWAITHHCKDWLHYKVETLFEIHVGGWSVPVAACKVYLEFDKSLFVMIGLNNTWFLVSSEH